MKHCPICQNSNLHIRTLRCTSCNVEVSGNLHTPLLARLGKEESAMAVELVLHGGNLKTMADAMGITYPTLRKRLDKTIEQLKRLQQEDEYTVQAILNRIEARTLPAEEGMRIIKEVTNDI